MRRTGTTCTLWELHLRDAAPFLQTHPECLAALSAAAWDQRWREEGEEAEGEGRGGCPGSGADGQASEGWGGGQPGKRAVISLTADSRGGEVWVAPDEGGSSGEGGEGTPPPAVTSATAGARGLPRC